MFSFPFGVWRNSWKWLNRGTWRGEEGVGFTTVCTCTELTLYKPDVVVSMVILLGLSLSEVGGVGSSGEASILTC